MVGELWSSTVSSVTGNVVTTGVEVYARGEERQHELDRRIIPNIPSWLQFAYLGGLIAGLLGWPVASGWFQRIWPPEQRIRVRRSLGYRAAQAARLMAFVLLFLPIVGGPALVVSAMQQLWALVTLPVRAARWLISRPQAGAG